MTSTTRIALVQALFFVSGFCGLIYESIWSHYLKLFLGHAAYAQSVVLVVFIGGMAIGAGVAGRYAERIRRPLLAYAAAEFVVGWAGIAFHAVFTASTGWAYETLLPATCSADGWCVSLVVARGAADPAAVDPARHDVPADDERTAAPRAGRSRPPHRAPLLPQQPRRGRGRARVGVRADPRWLGLPGASFAAGATNILLALAVWALATSGAPASRRASRGRTARRTRATPACPCACCSSSPR